MKQACRSESIVSLFFLNLIYISCSASIYRALYVGKIETQSSYIYIYILYINSLPMSVLKNTLKRGRLLCLCRRYYGPHIPYLCLKCH